MPSIPGVKLKLSVMMFLQYAVWGAWVVSMGGYMFNTLGFTGVQIGSVYSTTAIAAMISPLFMGYVADRLFATERIIGVLHLIGAALLGTAAFATTFQVLYPVMIVYALCYMPTLALTNSVTFANINDSEKDFPPIRVWGTWGWIVIGWVVGFVLQGAAFSKATGIAIPPNAPLVLAAGLSAILGIFSFSLPHTPPLGNQALQTNQTSSTGLAELLRNPTFLVFVLSSFLICIPLSFYYGFANVFLIEISAPYPTALQTIGQISEVFFMSAMPFFIQRLGVKKMLAVGMLAWVARYLAFGTLNTPLVIFGLVLHGVCYDFFFVASQIYVDTRVSTEHRARAQSFIAFITLGLGMFIGNYVAGIVVDRYVTRIPAVRNGDKTEMPGTPKAEPIPIPTWDDQGKSHFAKALGLKDRDASIEIAKLPEKYSEPVEGIPHVTSMDISREDLAAVAKTADRDQDGRVTRPEWQWILHDWFHIWLWPALAALATSVVFWFGFRDDNQAGSVARDAR